MSSTFKRVLAAALRYAHLFDLSGDERIRFFVEKAYRMGRSDLVRQQRTAAGRRRRKACRT